MLHEAYWRRLSPKGSSVWKEYCVQLDPVFEHLRGNKPDYVARTIIGFEVFIGLCLLLVIL